MAPTLAAAAQTDPAPATACRHCGADCGRMVVRVGDDCFCCEGCASVFALLQDRGLAEFYACEVSPGVSQRPVAARVTGRFAALDDATTAATLLFFDDGTTAGAQFSVPDMHCASCVWLLERLWRVDEAILRAEADLTRRTVRVWFRPDRLSVRGVAERLAAVGYEPLIEPRDAAGSGSSSRRMLYVRIGVAGFAFGNAMIFSIPRYVNGAPLEPAYQRLFDVLNLVLAIPVLLISAAPFFTAAWRALRARVLTLDVPVALGLAVLFLRSAADIVTGRDAGFLDSFTGLVFFLLIGRLFQQKTIERLTFDRTFRSFLPLAMQVEGPEGLALRPLDGIAAGDRLMARAQEIVPVDARLLDGVGLIDYAFVTGESHPVTVQRGDIVRAGGRVVGQRIRLEALGAVSQSQLASLWSSPLLSAPKTPWLADLSNRFGAGFTAIALLLAIAGAVAWWPNAGAAIQVFTAVLIIACPCALTLAAPVALGTAMTQLAEQGLYLKRATGALDLARIDTVVFDKTGTLTAAEPRPTISSGSLTGADWRLVRRLAAESTHPVSRAIAAAETAAEAETDADAPVPGAIEGWHEVPGHGVRGRVDGHLVAIGTPAFVSREIGAPVPAMTRTVVAIDGHVGGQVELIASPRPGIVDAIHGLRQTHALALLSGDHPEEASRWQPLFGDGMAFRQTPEQKLAFVGAQRDAGRHVLMVGDGLNDAGALAAADVGVAVSDAASCVVPACDAVIRGDRLAQLPAFLRYARRARQVIVACFLVSLVYNAVGISLALAGALTPLATAILMPLSSITIVGLSAGGMRWFAREMGPA